VEHKYRGAVFGSAVGRGRSIERPYVEGCLFLWASLLEVPHEVDAHVLAAARPIATCLGGRAGNLWREELLAGLVRRHGHFEAYFARLAALEDEIVAARAIGVTNRPGAPELAERPQRDIHVAYLRPVGAKDRAVDPGRAAVRLEGGSFDTIGISWGGRC